MRTTVKIRTDPHTEADHQMNVIAWSELHRNEYPDLALLFHVPNGGSRDAREGARLKQMGVKPGVPDLFLPVRRGTRIGLWIEMKKPDGKLRPEQEWWRDRLRREGYDVVTAYGWEQAVEAIKEYLR